MVYPRQWMIGIGLSANQVGLPYRMFVMLTTRCPAGFGMARVCINPEIIAKRDERDRPE